VAIHREDGDAAAIAQALINLGNVTSVLGDCAAAAVFIEEALPIFRRLGDMVAFLWAFRGLASIARRQGHYEAARQRLEECLSVSQELRPLMPPDLFIGTGVCVAMNLTELGDLAKLQGEYAEAEARYEQSLAAYKEIGDSGGMAASLNNLGDIACARGDYVGARSRYEQSLAIAVELGHQPRIAGLLESFAGLAAAQAQPERAIRLAGAAAVLRLALGTPLPPEEQTRFERNLEPARQMLPEALAAAVRAEGQSMSLQQALDDALGRKESCEDAALYGRPLQCSPPGGGAQ
jgi:tetratricopeptide (TPR) repeat protein